MLAHGAQQHPPAFALLQPDEPMGQLRTVRLRFVSGGCRRTAPGRHRPPGQAAEHGLDRGARIG
ncbi:hypothetical protein, partial [Streptomyces cacaoi]|uniref:hypothetical protein n=1 Tax=Streptomyces cacaoi TaxID=1898 RepID=UPI001F38A3A0